MEFENQSATAGSDKDGESTMSLKDRPIVIPSIDVDRSKFTDENLIVMRSHFPTLSDQVLAMYLIARQNDIEKAKHMLEKALRWKERRWPVLKRDCISEVNTGKLYVHGTDKEGRPLLVYRVCLHDPKKRDLETMARSVVWWTEQALSRLPGDKTQISVIFDRTDGSAANQDHEFYKQFLTLFADQCPERLHKAIVYPCGLVFWAFWNVMKWFLDPVTRSKVHTCMYLSGVQEHVDDEFIPATMVSFVSYSFATGLLN